jgi:endo-beta-N-acetylglucosaminidase D/PKD repeat protein
MITKLNGYKLIAGLFLACSICMAWSGTASAKQPTASAWFVDDLLQWSPETDPDAAFNRASIPLASRTNGGYQVNPNASTAPKLAALSAMYQSTSKVPSQGSEQFDVYAFQYWQYVDLLVHWAGSSSEGIIVPPSADAIDSAHKNGVPILGNIFYPPTAYGGKFSWVTESLQKNPDGSFPFADKLIEAADYYGFDGWFINQETAGGNAATASLMQEFLKYLQAHKKPGMQMQWYDAMNSTGAVGWQRQLNNNNAMFVEDNGRVSDSMFIDFSWNPTGLNNSRAKAESLGRSPYDIYAGIDVEANGTGSNPNWGAIFPNGQPATLSLGIYRPDWAFKVHKSREDLYAKENLFWVGQNGDPSRTTTAASWKGIANYFVEKTPVTKLPFITNFNTGNGDFFAVDGEVLRTKPWNNRSLQDVMPTWRWIAISQGTALKPSIDFSSAYYGGSSLKVAGNLLNAKNATQVKLYKTELPVAADTSLALTFKTNTPEMTDSNMQVGIAFADAPDQFVFLDVGEASPGEWRTKNLPLAAYQGKTIAAISLNFTSQKAVLDYSVNIGRLSVTAAAEQGNEAGTVGELTVQNEFTTDISADARIKWSKAGSNAAYYEIYLIKQDGSREFQGATPNNAYYVPSIKRIGKEPTSVIEVVPVDQYYRQGAGTQAIIEWPEYPKPEAKFTADAWYAAPGDAITFFDQSFETKERVVWEFPGGTVDYSSGNPKVTYAQEGTYTVKLTAINSAGEDTATAQVTVTSSIIGGKLNMALGKPDSTFTADSQCAAGEAAKFAFDGNAKTKWCANSAANPHWVKVDLGQKALISEFRIGHAAYGGEADAMNTDSYKIQISNDNAVWTDVATVEGNTKSVTEHNIPLTEVRYVRLQLDKATATDNTGRIYEFEVYGFKSRFVEMMSSVKSAADMQAALESPGLNLNLSLYNKLDDYTKRVVSYEVWENKPADGFTDKASLQAAVDVVVQVYVEEMVRSAIEAVNGAQDAASMKTALEASGLGLTLELYSLLDDNQKSYVASELLVSRPAEGYVDQESIRAAFEARVFGGIRGHWAESELIDWIKKGILKADDKANLDPDLLLKRSELISLLNKGLIKELTFEGIMAQIAADNSMDAELLISREELLAIISKTLALDTAVDADALSKFTDVDLVKLPFKPYINALLASGLAPQIAAGETLSPQKEVTLAEAVILLRTALTYDGGESPGDGDGDGGNPPVDGGGYTPPVTPPAPPTKADLTISANGSGTVKLNDEMTVIVPAGTSAQELRISIEKLANASQWLSSSDIVLSPVYELLKNMAGSFGKPVSLSIAFDSSKVGANRVPAIFYYDEVSKKWVKIGGKAAGGIITAEVDHFTKFTVFSIDAKDAEELKPPVSFIDISGHWAENSIKDAAAKGIASGYPDSSFKPNARVTRAEFTVMLVHALQLKGEAKPLTFKDSDKVQSWAKEAVSLAAEAGIISGYEDGTFRADAVITRAQMVTMIVKAAGLPLNEVDSTTFADDAAIAAWAKGYVMTAIQSGIVQGRGGNRFAPNDSATRAESVTVLLKMLELIKK